jgi:hypothetical protein
MTDRPPTDKYEGAEEQGPEQVEHPGRTTEMERQPDHGEESYRGTGKLTGRRALITGADSGIGRAVAIAFARRALTSSCRISSPRRLTRGRRAGSWGMRAVGLCPYRAISGTRGTAVRSSTGPCPSSAASTSS